VEDDLEGGEDNKRSGSRKPQKDKERRKTGHDEVRLLRSIIIAGEL